MAEYKLGFYGEEIDLKLQEIETLKNQIIALQGNIEQLTANNETITDAIEALSNAGSGAIKRVITGTYGAIGDNNTNVVGTNRWTNYKFFTYNNSAGYGMYVYYYDFTIPEVNPDKCVVQHWGITNTNNAVLSDLPYEIINSTTLRLYALGVAYPSGMYRITEFY